MQLSPFWTLLSKILRQDREISPFLSKNFRDFRLTFRPRFARRLCYKVLLFEYGGKLRLYKPYASFGGEALSRAEPPAGPPKNDLDLTSGRFSENFAKIQIWEKLQITNSNRKQIFLNSGLALTDAS